MEQAKLRAHETLQYALLGDDAAADSDYTVVEQAKLKHANFEEHFVGWAASQRLKRSSCCSLRWDTTHQAEVEHLRLEVPVLVNWPSYESTR